MSDDQDSKPERCKVLYHKTVSTEGIVEDDGDFIRLSRDEGKTWSRINKKLIQLTIPIKDKTQR